MAIGPYALGQVELKAHVEIGGVVAPHAVCRKDNTGTLGLFGELFAVLAIIALKDLFGAPGRCLDLGAYVISLELFGSVFHTAK